jgi:hypothetical protein
MTDSDMPRRVKDQSEQANPEQVGQQARQSQASAVAERDQRVAPGRRPLFRN